MTDTIDLTPRGLTTPEGAQRVNAATEAFEHATANVANAATSFFDEHRATLLEASRGVLLAEEDRLALRDALHQMDAVIGARKRKTEEFLRAVAGVPVTQ
jgi:hypothetical protein